MDYYRDMAVLRQMVSQEEIHAPSTGAPDGFLAALVVAEVPA
jgi:hypothetical protein